MCPLDLVNELDTRYEEKVMKEGGTMPRKPRVDGVPSTSKPPVDAPEWAVKQVRHAILTNRLICLYLLQGE